MTAAVARIAIACQGGGSHTAFTAGVLGRLFNPEAVAAVPRRITEILDRRNELGGNLSLNQEVHFITKINALLRRLRREYDVPLHPEFKEVRVGRITMSAELSARLDAASKLDRDPRLIAELEADGRRQADAFLCRRAAGAVTWEVQATAHTQRQASGVRYRLKRRGVRYQLVRRADSGYSQCAQMGAAPRSGQAI